MTRTHFVIFSLLRQFLIVLLLPASLERKCDWSLYISLPPPSVAPTSETTLNNCDWCMGAPQHHWWMKNCLQRDWDRLWPAGDLFAKSSGTTGPRYMQRHAEQSMQAKNDPPRRSSTKDGRGTLSDTCFFLYFSFYVTAIVASERSSNTLKQKNGATVSGIICPSVRLNHTDKAELESGPGGHCSLIICWYVHRVISCRTAQ